MIVRVFLFLALFCTCSASRMNQQCRELFTCAVQKGCLNVPLLTERVNNKSISVETFDDVDAAINYGCLFTTGCIGECNDCPICYDSKKRMIELLGGEELVEGTECYDLMKCTNDCFEKTDMYVEDMIECTRHSCAFHCFSGSCTTCSALVTRVFNRMCVVGKFRSIIQGGFKGQCHEMFRDIVHSKFEAEFRKAGKKPDLRP